MLTCKGDCRTKYSVFLGEISLRYNGQKRCGVCDVYLKWDDSKCPCCNSILHVRPRHSRAKSKYYESKGVRWI
ncbi:MAG: hypothetical protein EPO62_05450 [Candidatus Nitrosotenuis sp.]|nr:MAG: hypothetical protein EPO62_05450 [Candidatus Nitrosotenuis sp.]